MSTQIANVNLAGAVVGQSGTVSWAQLLPPPTIAQQMRPTQAGGSNISLFNESPCLLTVTLPVTGQTFTLPAGRWVAVAVPPLEISLRWTVTAVAGTGLYNALLVDFFAPGETPHPIGTLGNSPIGGSVSVTSAGDLDQYLVTPGVLTGVVATADPIVLNRLDVTAGVTFLKQSSGNVEPQATLAQNFFTSIPSTTYFLDINPDGSFSWGTTHSAVPNALQLWQVSTDGSGQIFIVSPLNYSNPVTVLPNAISLQLGQQSTILSFPEPIAQVGGQATTGSLGVPAVVAKAFETHITTIGQKTILAYALTVASGTFRVSGWLDLNNGTNLNGVVCKVNYTDPVTNTARSAIIGGSFAGASSALAMFNGNNQGNDFFAFVPLTFDASQNGQITVTYNDPTNTPNDFITVVLERLL